MNQRPVLEEKPGVAPVEILEVDDLFIPGGPANADQAYLVPPVPYDEQKYHGANCTAGKPDWIDDYGDQLLPRRKGFLTDFIYFTRGIMTPTVACIWTAFFVLSSSIKREAWLKWVPQELHTNQYIIIVGPAGLTKKTTAVTGFGLPLLRKFRSYIADRNIYEMKHVDVVKDKTSPESLLTAMSPESKPHADYYLRDPEGELLLDQHGRAIPVRRTSEVALIVSELSTLLSNSSYMQTMTQILLDLYDCHDDWEWRTERRGIKILRWMHTTLLAGTTVDGFRDALPRAAKGDGFLSRSILVYTPQSKRKYPQPFFPEGAPDMEEMARRLAWVATQGIGEYELTPEAMATYELWYETYYKRMEDFPEYTGAVSRMDVNVLKTALLIRLQRYDAYDTVVDEEDLIDAIRIIEVTYNAVPFLIGQLEEDVILRNVEKIGKYLEQRGQQKRMHLLSVMHLRSDILTFVLEELIGRGLIATEFQGQRSLVVYGKAEEIYVWLGGKHVGNDEAERLWSAQGFIDTRTLRLNTPGLEKSRSKPHSDTTLADGKPGRVRRGVPENPGHRKSRRKA
jgi:hypothetical protein